MAVKRKWAPEDVQQWYRVHRTNLYWNREDASVFVRKYRRLGWTLNFANPRSYLFLCGILATVLLLVTVIESIAS